MRTRSVRDASASARDPRLLRLSRPSTRTAIVFVCCSCINMTNVVLAPRASPHIYKCEMVLSPPLVYLVSFLVSSVSRLDLLSRLCLSSVLWCGLWSGLWSGAALSSPVGCRFSPHMKNKHTKKIKCSCMSIGSHNMLTTAYGSPTCSHDACTP